MIGRVQLNTSIWQSARLLGISLAACTCANFAVAWASVQVPPPPPERLLLKRKEVPVQTGNQPHAVPKGDRIVTQVIPLRYITAAEMSRTLASLLPEKASLIATGEGNSLILTDTLTSIHRILEIVQAIDTAVPGQISIEVFRLTFADAKSLAAVLKDLFAPQTSTRSDAQNRSSTTRDPNGANPTQSVNPSANGDGAAAAGSTLAVTTLAFRGGAEQLVACPHFSGLLPTIRKLIKQLDLCPGPHGSASVPPAQCRCRGDGRSPFQLVQHLHRQLQGRDSQFASVRR